jgi:hypothetical protein
MTAKEFLHLNIPFSSFGLFSHDEMTELMESYGKYIRNSTIEEIAEKFGDFPFEVSQEDILSMKK